MTITKCCTIRPCRTLHNGPRVWKNRANHEHLKMTRHHSLIIIDLLKNLHFTLDIAVSVRNCAVFEKICPRLSFNLKKKLIVWFFSLISLLEIQIDFIFELLSGPWGHQKHRVMHVFKFVIVLERKIASLC